MPLEENHTQATTLCIIRHGETDWNATGRLQGREDVELNEKGRQQAILLAGYFKTGHWDVIVTSPLKRAFETAQIISYHLTLPDIHIIDELVERDYGKASGLLPEERRELYPESIPGQEDFEHLRQRAMSALQKIIERFHEKNIIVVSHGGIINSMLYTISGGEFGSFKTRLKNGAINKIICQNNKWVVEFYNKTVEELISEKK